MAKAAKADFMELNDRTEIEQTDLLSAALEYAQLGYRVLPLEPRRKRPHKRLAPTGSKAATSDPAIIGAWWAQAPDASIGLVAGGLLVMDIDPRNGGDRGLERLSGLYGELPDTGPVARPGGGGLHIFFKGPEKKIGSSNGKIATGVDIKTSGYVMVAPSVTTGPTPGSAGSRLSCLRRRRRKSRAV